MKFVENNYCELKSILTKDIKKEIMVFANTNKKVEKKLYL